MTLEKAVQDVVFILEASRAHCERLGVRKITRKVRTNGEKIVKLEPLLAPVIGLGDCNSSLIFHLPDNTPNLFDEGVTTDDDVIHIGICHIMDEFEADVRRSADLVRDNFTRIDFEGLQFRWAPAGMGPYTTGMARLFLSEQTIELVENNKKQLDKEYQEKRRIDDEERRNKDKAESESQAKIKEKRSVAFHEEIERLLPGWGDARLPVPCDLLFTLVDGLGLFDPCHFTAAVDSYNSEKSFIAGAESETKHAGQEITMANSAEVLELIEAFREATSAVKKSMSSFSRVTGEVVLVGWERDEDDQDEEEEWSLCFYLLIVAPDQILGAFFPLVGVDGSAQSKAVL